MVFTPENVKKLQDIVVVVYKGKHGTYEVAAHPKRLYEYRRKTASLEDVLCTESIFSDISRGRLASRKSISEEFKKDNRGALEVILSQGTERKDSATREYEQESARKAVAEGLLQRVRKENNRRLTQEEAEAVLKTINYTPSTKPMKVQISDAIKKAVQLGYSKRAIQVRAGKGMDWAALKSSLPAGSFIRETARAGVVEMSDDLYGPVHRAASAQGVELEDLPEDEEAGAEVAL
ncbi:ribosome maturation protein SDO1 [Nematocida major]|uniref:ribosome maturation protein SDO1 n=1 Tax=Nematocida major TaxID=1912982 RepID=UPI0020074D7F|nr:ribosome maturation protein SDO1 [Nematocida major]KAH9386312.1 ribosome maturation protein SDO1 [Nematocida major]